MAVAYILPLNGINPMLIFYFQKFKICFMLLKKKTKLQSVLQLYH